MNLKRYAVLSASAVAGLIISTSAMAIHSDIEIEIEGGQWVADPENEVPIASLLKPGLKIFESEFGELGNDFGTDDPGMEVPDGTGTPGNLLSLKVEDTLWKWDGASWLSSGFDEIITITDALDETVDVSATGIVGDNDSVIDQFDAGGGIHSHVEFEISAPGTPMDGAYLLELSLFGPDATASDSFLIAFHLDAGGTFGEEAFEAAIDAGLAPVPVPAAVYLFGSALAFMGGFRKYRKA